MAAKVNGKIYCNWKKYEFVGNATNLSFMLTFFSSQMDNLSNSISCTFQMESPGKAHVPQSSNQYSVSVSMTLH